MQIIHDDPPMRDEIAAGFYPAFESRWRKAEVWGRIAMAAFVVEGDYRAQQGPQEPGMVVGHDQTLPGYSDASQTSFCSDPWRARPSPSVLASSDLLAA